MNKIILNDWPSPVQYLVQSCQSTDCRIFSLNFFHLLLLPRIGKSSYYCLIPNPSTHLHLSIMTSISLIAWPRNIQTSKNSTNTRVEGERWEVRGVWDTVYGESRA